MSLIINKSIPQMMTGYPTMSDKYNVTSAIYGSDVAANFGELLKNGTTAGSVLKATSLTAVTDIAGIAVATNVKLADQWPGTTATIKKNEAVGILLDGYIAVELDSGATEAKVTPGAKMCVIMATGKLTTIDKAATTTIVELPGYVFTGIKEKHGTALIAEVCVK